MNKVVLIHGYVKNDVENQVREMIGEHHIIDCYQDGGYMLNLATTEEVDQFTADDIIGCLYDNEDDIPDVTGNPDDPVFLGLQTEPVELTTDNDDTFLFVGGVWGYEEDDDNLYQQ